jgi:5'-nucleotidase
MQPSRLPWTCLALSSALCAACAEPAPSPRIASATSPSAAPTLVKPPPPPVTLTFLGLNDLHGRIRALPAFAGYANNVRRVRARSGGAVALVDAGDMFQGTLESNLNEGAAVISAYQALGMTVAALGNHEFDFGPDGKAPAGDPQGAIRARIAESPFPILSANLVQKGTTNSPPWDKLRRSALVEIGGVRVGFVGLLTAETPSIVMSAWFQGLDVEPLAPILEREARELRGAGAELVIAVAHAGADCKDFSNPADLGSCHPSAEIFDVARALPRGTVDAIFAGHSHAGVAHVVNGVPIVEAYARGRAFSRIDFYLDGATHRVLEAKVFPPHELCPKLAETGTCTLTEYEGAPTLEDPRIAQAIAPALAQAESRRSAPIGCMVQEKLSCEHAVESPLGNLFADLLRDGVEGSDVAILNGGSLRAELPAGALSYGQLFESMPFDNLVARVRITGAELKAVVLSHIQHDDHGLISVSGVRVKAHCTPKGVALELYRDNGKPVKDTDSLLLATSDYLATGGDALFQPIALGPERIAIDINESFRDTLARALQKRPQVSPKDPAIFDPSKPRMKLASPRPMLCSAPAARPH